MSVTTTTPTTTPAALPIHEDARRITPVPTRRPAGVTMVGAIATVSGILGTLGGVLALIVGSSVQYGSIAAGVQILLGIITLAVAAGLLRGSNSARIVISLVFLLNIASVIFLPLALGGVLWAAVASAVLALVGLILLWTARANEYFRS